MPKINLEEIQARGLPYATIESIGAKITPYATTQEGRQRAIDKLSKLTEYLEHFTMLPENVCPGCGRKLCGLLGTFTWDIVHGEGRCDNCGYPARGMHYEEDAGITMRNFVIPYHPDELHEREPDHAAD